jgi:hypothetical protein
MEEFFIKLLTAAMITGLLYLSIGELFKTYFKFKREEKKYLTNIRVNYENGTTVELNLSDSPRTLAYCQQHNHYYTKWGSNTCGFCWSEQLENTILKQFKNGRNKKRRTKSRD